MGSTGSKAEPTTQAVPSQEDYEATLESTDIVIIYLSLKKNYQVNLIYIYFYNTILCRFIVYAEFCEQLFALWRAVRKCFVSSTEEKNTNEKKFLYQNQYQSQRLQKIKVGVTADMMVPGGVILTFNYK